MPTAADNTYSSLLDRCVEPSVAANWFQGFSGAASYRGRYDAAYNAKCRHSSGEKIPTSSVFTPQLMAQVQQAQQVLQSKSPHLVNNVAIVPVRPGISTSVTASSPSVASPAVVPGNAKLDCPADNAYVFCNKKIPNASRLTGDAITASDWDQCESKCAEMDGCVAWDWDGGTCNFAENDEFEPSDNHVAGKVDKTNGVAGGGDAPASASPTTTPPPSNKKWWIVAAGAVSLIALLVLVLVIALNSSGNRS